MECAFNQLPCIYQNASAEILHYNWLSQNSCCFSEATSKNFEVSKRRQTEQKQLTISLLTIYGPYILCDVAAHGSAGVQPGNRQNFRSYWRPFMLISCFFSESFLFPNSFGIKIVYKIWYIQRKRNAIAWNFWTKAIIYTWKGTQETETPWRETVREIISRKFNVNLAAGEPRRWRIRHLMLGELLHSLTQPVTSEVFFEW